ncbi:MAG: cell surface protein SprA, partial [Bacteroidales bacterium]|nr:cell surface protein SprA [Bacteroidales bacterium]
MLHAQYSRLPDAYKLHKPFLLPYDFDKPGLGIDLQNPRNFRLFEEYDGRQNEMTVRSTVGPLIPYRQPFSLPLSDFLEFDRQRFKTQYWYDRQRSSSVIEEQVSDGLIAPIYVNSPIFDKVFGTNVISIVPQGTAETTFGIKTSKTDNPNLSEQARRSTSFDFDTNLQMNVTGTVGDKMRVGISYNTQASFEFDNEAKLEYVGKEDEILRRVEAGNVSFSVPGTLISGSQSLFGVRADMQFGRLSVSTVLSQQKSEYQNVSISGGSQTVEFEAGADSYDANRHFFLSQYFRDHYEQALAGLPIVNSGITITRMEVWVTNKTTVYTNSRNVAAFMDLGESTHIWHTPFSRSAREQVPQNDTDGLFNTLYQTVAPVVRDINTVTAALDGLGLTAGIDYEKLQNARLLTTSEYTYNAQLGYISLNTPLTGNEVLAVAYEYTYRGQTYKVGELSTSGVPVPQTLVAKLLKPTNLSPRYPVWDLMMKNVYALQAYQLEKDGFDLQILYQDDASGTDLNHIPESGMDDMLLLRVMQLDRLNSQQDPYPDGVFDFVPSVTVDAEKGRIFFPVLEPFGRTLRAYMASRGVDEDVIDNYVYQALYDSTLTVARLQTEHNKFLLRGTYRAASGSEIILNAYNIPEGSVVVSAGGTTLVEGVDYTVDYLGGRVIILNQAVLASGRKISVSLENNTMYNVQTKTLMGTHLDYAFSDRFNMGATLLRLRERPLTQKVNFGDEPMANTMFGLNASYHTESDWLTRLIDRWPLMNASAPSSVSFEGEVAGLVPGSSSTLQHRNTAYIDDFESSESSYELKTFSAWSLASIPHHNKFAEAALTNDLTIGMNRALTAWYVIDPMFVNKSYFTSSTPAHIRNDADSRSSHFVAPVYEEDIFKNREHLSGESTLMSVLNVAYYPSERGPYNYETTGTAYSAGVNPDGTLRDPASRWGGLMRQMTATNFEASNIESLEFWLMDPFVEDVDGTQRGGDLYFNFGNISEDILKDGRKAYENGLPTGTVPAAIDSTAWGYVPQAESLVNAFSQGAIARQDVGLDGMPDGTENRYFESYLQQLSGAVHDGVLQNALRDPSSDNFRYPRGPDWDAVQAGILQRYKYYNGVDGNSTVSGYTNSGLPSVEDINGDNTLSETESYYQYHVSLRPEDLQEVGRNFIVDIVPQTVTFPNGVESTVNWYQFRIPLNDYEQRIGGIDGFTAIQFMRMFLTNFQDSVVLRFATMDLIRSEWRKYTLPLQPASAAVPEDDEAEFETGTLNIEDNAGKDPVGYVLPPGFDRAVNQSSTELQQLNEQSMMLKVKNLPNGDARAVYKTVSYDLRRYKQLKMEVHAEQIAGSPLADEEMTVFIRLGSDARSNYYEYEVPLQLTPWGSVTPEEVWPELNAMDIVLDYFVEAKQARNDAMRRAGSGVTLTTPYTYEIEEEKFVVVGNPNLSNVKTIMIGVRYPFDPMHAGERRSVEVWVNELRLSDFSNNGGWAANARVVLNLSDFASLSLTGSKQTAGFGSINSKVTERSTDNVQEYAVGFNAELGKLLPERLGLQIPMYASYAETFVTPEYDPQQPDVLFKDALDHAGSAAGRDSIRRYAEDYTRHRSLNFTNVRIAPEDARETFYSLSNFTLDYAFYETYRRNVTQEYAIDKQYRGGLMYSYTFQPKSIAPFAESSWAQRRWLRLLKEFNFNPLPSRVSFRTEFVRDYAEKKTRSLTSASAMLDPTVDKNFFWYRSYELSWDLTRSMRFDFSAGSTARIDEPEGVVSRRNGDAYDAWRDSVMYNIRHAGRVTEYAQQLRFSYTLPVNKLPLLNWLSSSLTYNATYEWQASPVTREVMGVKFNPGNTITNSSSLTFNNIANLQTIYNLSPYFRQLLNPMMKRAEEEKQITYKKVVFERVKMNFTGGRDRYITHDLKTRRLEVTVVDAEGKKHEVDVQVVSENRIAVRAREDIRGATLTVTGMIEKHGNHWELARDAALRLLLGLRDVTFYYTENGNTTLPGYAGGSGFLGMKGGAPGLPFAMGWQDRLFADKAMRRGWLTQDTSLIQQFGTIHGRTVNLRATYMPVTGLTIRFRGSRTFSENQTSYYVYENGGFPESYRHPVRSGRFSISVTAFGTSFETPDEDDGYRSASFDRFVAYRQDIARRQAGRLKAADPAYAMDENAGGGYNGYSLSSQEVLIPAFLAAYTGRSPEKVPLGFFPSLKS